MARRLFFIVLLSFSSNLTAHAQTVVDPNYVEFTASPDHNVLENNGAPRVTRYDLLLYAAGSTSPLRTVSLGRPQPDSAGTIRLGLGSILNPLPAGGTTYEVRIAAVGTGGSSSSNASNGFSYQVACTYTVSPSSRSVAASGGTSSFSVTAPAGCAWTAATATTWITITSGRSGSGSGTVSFTTGTNSTTATRNGSIVIAGQARTVTQAGAPCSYAVSPLSQSVSRGGGQVSYTVTTASGCSWSASEQASWISVASGGTGNGSGTVIFAVQANAGTQPRTASLTIAGRAVILSQAVSVAPTAPTGMRIVR